MIDGPSHNKAPKHDDESAEEAVAPIEAREAANDSIYTAPEGKSREALVAEIQRVLSDIEQAESHGRAVMGELELESDEESGERVKAYEESIAGLKTRLAELVAKVEEKNHTV